MSKTIETIPNTTAAPPVTAVTTAPAPLAGHASVTTAPGANAPGSPAVKTRPLSWYPRQGIKGLASLRLTVVLFTL